MTGPRVAVLGAGAAGLAAGLALRDGGVDCVVLEAAPRAGGKLGTLRKDGFLLESAAIGMLDREGDLLPLCARLGLRLLPARPGARFVERDGKVHRLGPGLLRPRELVSLARLPFTRRAALEGESVLDYFRRRAGRAGDFLADALQTGIYAGDPARLEMASAFPRRAAKAARRATLSSFVGGMQELVDALAAALGEGLRCGTRVRAVEGTAPPYRLLLEDTAAPSAPSGRAPREGEPGRELQVDAIICALPAPETARLFPALAPLLAPLEAAPLSLVHFGVEGPGPQAFGLLAPGSAVPGLLFPAALWEGRAPAGRALATALVGGARHPEAAALADAPLAALAREALQRRFGLRAGEPLHIARWPQAVPQPLPGHAARLAALERALPPAVRLAGAWFRGVSVLDCLRQGRHAASPFRAT